MYYSLRSQYLFRTLSLLVAMLYLVSCSEHTTTVPVDHVSTAVAATLTSQPTRTPPPSITPIPSPTTDLPPTPTASSTPTPGPSPTASPPPLPAGDPRSGLNLSLPDYQDQFNISTTWGGPNNEAARNMIKDGYFEAIDYLADTYVWWSTTVPEGRDIYIEVTAEIANCSGKDSAGLGLRIGGNQYDSGYTLEVSCDGHYRVRSFTGGSITTLLDWTASDEILKGSSAINLLGLVAKGNTLHVAVNRVVVGSVDDFSFYSGTFALFSNALETPGLTIKFDDFKIWYF